MRGGFRRRMVSDNEEEDFKLKELNRNHLHLLFKYLRPHLFKLILAVLSMFVVTSATLVSPYLTKVAIDDYIAPGDLSGLNYILMLFVLIYAIYWLASYFQTYFSSCIGQKVTAEIRSDLNKHVIGLDIDFFNKRQTGDIMSRITHDVNSVQNIVTSGFVHLLNDLFTLTGIVVIMLLLNPVLALISFTTIPLILGVISILGKRMRNAYRDVQERLAEMNADVEENIAGIRVVQALNREAENTGKFSRLSWENLKANLRAVSIFALLFPTMNLSRVLGEALVLGYGGFQVIQGNLTLGILMAFLGYVRRFFAPLADLSQVYNTYQIAGASLDRIWEYLSKEPEIVEPEETECPASGFEGGFSFEKVSFSYGDEQVFKDFDLHVNSGETFALVGPTGAGKTTAVNLLTRMYEPDHGRVSIDGINVKKIKTRKLREIIGVVPQQIYLFNTTILENIRYGNFKADDEQVKEAARKARAHDFISGLPAGYDTDVGEDGVKLSGGQKQLVSFARALLLDPKILILDEATSSVDAYTELLVQEALGELLKERTALMIAHRFSTLKRADRIGVLDSGILTAEGTHEELMEESPLYRSLFEKQNKRAV